MTPATRNWRFGAGLLAAALTFAACSDDAPSTEAASDASSDSMEMSDHDHAEGYELPEGTTVPTVSIEVEADPKSGANLYVEVDDFTVDPESASTEPVPGEGHFHLFVDGERVARFYNQALHLDLEEGEHTVMVEVSANNHAVYTVDGEPIMAMATVEVPPKAEGHGHTDVVEAAEPIPTVTLSATADPKSGWNLFADVADFTFAPRQAGLDNVDGQGHLHLYVDDYKIGRLYGPWWHLPALPAGTHEVSVEVTANSHAPYGVDGKAIVATTTIEVSEEEGTDDAMAMPEGDHEHSHEAVGITNILGMAAVDADTLVTVTITDGNVEIDDNRVKVDEGSTVGLLINSDQDDRVHVHGYEIIIPIDGSTPVDIAFTADLSGSFEVELEDVGLFLFDLQVS